MDNKERLETLWESHNFYLKQINTLEEEFAFLVERARVLFYQPVIETMRKMDADPLFEATLPPDVVKDVKDLLKDYDGEEVPVEKRVLLPQIKRVSKDLDALYLKHLHTLKDIKAFYRDFPYDVPANHELSDPKLIDHLAISTKRLIKAHRKSARILYKEVKSY